MAKASNYALAYLLTWTTYGTWLRGDRRGYVGKSLAGGGSVVPARNEFGTPYDADDGRTLQWDANSLKSEPVRLSAEQALCVAEALGEGAGRSGYEIVRASVMQDHVHVVVLAHPDGKNEVFRRLKGISAVRLTQRFGRPPAKAGCLSSGRGTENKGGRWWTQDGSKREKRGEAAVAAAVEYVAAQEHKLAEIVDDCVVRTG